MRILLLIFTCVLLYFTGCSCCAADKITNSDISKGSDGWRFWARKGTPEFAVDNAVGHNDNSSLRITVDKKGVDGGWVQTFQGSGFTKHHFDFWFKTKEPNKNIRFLAEFSTGSLYAGQFGQTFTSNGTEWTHAEGNFDITLGCSVQVSLWDNLDDLDICTVWFDDLQISDVSSSAYIHYGITTPVNRLITAATKTITVEIKTFGASGSPDYTCDLNLKSGNDVIAAKSVAVLRDGNVTLKLPKKLPPGTYYLQATIKDKNGNILTETTDVLIRRDSPAKISIGNYDELRINNKPFFPISVYWPLASDLKALSEAGFNSAHIGWGSDVKSYMDEAEKFGMYCPVEIPQYSRGEWNRQQFIDKVDSLLKYPNLLAYYTSDEPSFNTCPPSLLKDAYNIIKERDQDRPVMFVDYQKLQYQLNKVGVDIIGTDPYEAPSGIEESILMARSSANPGQPVWNVIGAFPATDGTLPTPEYIRAAIYTSLISGARGIFYFSYHYGSFEMSKSVLWDGIKTLNSEIHAMTPYLLGAKPRMLLGKGSASAAVFPGKSGKLVLIVNKTDKPVSVAIPMGKGKGKSMFGGEAFASGLTVNMDLKPYETRAYLIGK